MSIGITQLILLVIVAILLFGNIPKIFKDLSTGIVTFKKALARRTTPESDEKKDVLSLKELNPEDKDLTQQSRDQSSKKISIDKNKSDQ